MMFGGLSTVNVELTNRCNKSCWMCGRRKIEWEYPHLVPLYGDMDFSLVQNIATQLPSGVVVQFHNNGEPLLYPKFGDAVRLFEGQIKCVDTNAKLLVEKAEEIIGILDTLTVSVIPFDPDAEEQYRVVKKFVKLKGKAKPLMVYRLLTGVKPGRWENLKGLIAYRQLHSPLGSFDYERKPTMPEIGICLEAVHHLSIGREGLASMCVRFDPTKEAIIGNAKKETLNEIWNGTKRLNLLAQHIRGNRNLPLCKHCKYWGIPG